jgi:hypothetical protein
MNPDVRETTILDLIMELQLRGVCSENEIVAMITQLLKTGRIRLRGIYADTHQSFS